MKKPSASKKSLSTAKTKPDSLSGVLTEVRQLIQSARRGVATVVDTFQVMTNFEIGRRIVEHEQKGAKRAAYGAELLKELSARLTEEFGRGFSRSNLQSMRAFFIEWQNKVPPICQTASGKLLDIPIFQSLTEKSAASEIPQTVSGKLVPAQIRQTLSGKSPFTLSWSHYVVLMTIKDPDERSFYEIESWQADWDVRELKRQKASCLYERLALSRDKEGIRKLAKEGQVIVRPEDLLKEPLVLEFLGLEEKSGYSENDLEQAIIDRLEHFLLELGKGFLFEARQKRFTFDEDHYFVDLVFYYRVTKDSIKTVNFAQKWATEEGEEEQAFRDLGEININASEAQGEPLSGGVTTFGLVSEFENGLKVVASDLSILEIPGPITRWRVFPRSVRYENQLHVILDNALEIYSFNQDYFVDQSDKKIGTRYKAKELRSDFASSIFDGF